eukprot:scaffold349697_cov20-Prasinocladus_malaysianus.AAC.1
MFDGLQGNFAAFYCHFLPDFITLFVDVHPRLGVWVTDCFTNVSRDWDGRVGVAVGVPTAA